MVMSVAGDGHDEVDHVGGSWVTRGLATKAAEKGGTQHLEKKLDLW